MNLIPLKSCVLLSGLLSFASIADANPTEMGAQNANEKTGSSFLYEVLKPVAAQPYWYVQTSLYTRHFKPRSEHNNHQELLGVERHTASSYLWGAATFLHSYDERAYYAYLGKRFDWVGTPFYGKLTAGLLHGYKGEYRDKIPLNRFETAPVIIPSVGLNYHRVGVEVLLLGGAATMINIGFQF